MKTDLKTLGTFLLLLSSTAMAQETDLGSTTVISPAPAAIPSLGTETDRTRSVAANPASGTSSAVGILVKNGKAYLLRSGQLTAVEEPLSLTVSPDGSITGFDGKTISLPEGRMLTMDGALTAIPNPVAETMVPGLPAQNVPDAMAKANEEMSKANREPATSNFTTGAGTDEQGGSAGPSKSKGTGGSGGSNRTRNAEDNSTSAMGAGSR